MNVLLLLEKEFMKTKTSLPAFFFFSLSLSSCFLNLFFLSSPPNVYYLLWPTVLYLFSVLALKLFFVSSFHSLLVLYFTFMSAASPFLFILKFSCLPPLVTAAAFILPISACQTNGNKNKTAQHNTTHKNTTQHNNIQENIRH